MAIESFGWSQEERVKFLDGLSKYGSDWNRISLEIESKTVQEVYEYATIHYKNIMSGKDLRSIDTTKNSVCMALMVDKIKTEQVDDTFEPNTKENTVANGHMPLINDSIKVEICEMPTEPSTSPPKANHNGHSSINKSFTVPPNVYKTGLSGNPYENRIKNLSDADIKLLLRKRILEMAKRRQENLEKRKLHENFATQQIMAFQAKHGVNVPGTPSNQATTPSNKSSRHRRQAVLAPKNKRRKTNTVDGFAGVNALAMISCEELQKYHQFSAPKPLTTPASQQASVPREFLIAPKTEDKIVSDVAKRTRWTAEEHERFLEGLKLHGRKWKKVQEHVKTKTKEQVRSHANAYFAKVPQQEAGDVLEVAGFLSSLSRT
ncbi:hypothetical protein THRCLA_05088 [Thraustotheca clavata]|uniref:Myb-like DNA-binding protein n=1 Tax=Thraustotheca clavata TaxID=74557 RepID=A0A1V9ZWY8_9STRA|nr:hypothetical protein THRCLA_05088 [Thraustotheca clavata]